MGALGDRLNKTMYTTICMTSWGGKDLGFQHFMGDYILMPQNGWSDGRGTWQYDAQNGPRI